DSPDGLSATTTRGVLVPISGSSQDPRPRALVFFSPWCESYLAKSRPAASQACRNMREEVNALAPGSNVQWLGVASGLWATSKDLAEYEKDPGTTIPLTLDADGKLFRSFGVRSVPTVILIDAQGRITRRIEPTERDLKQAVASLR